MKSKFESIVQEEMQKIENPTLEEGDGFWGAVKTAAANTAKNVMYGDQQGKMETGYDYASRMGWGGDQHKEYTSKGYNNYKPGNKPVIIDWKRNYQGFFATLANDARTKKVEANLLKPTIKTFINGIDFDQPPNNQQGFFVICAEKFGSRTLNQYRSRLPTRREAKEYDVDGVRYRMANVDFNPAKTGMGSNPDTIYGNSYFFATLATDYEKITEWDKQIYINDVVAILRPYMDKLINGVDEIQKLINAKTEGKTDDTESDTLPDVESFRGTAEDAKREQYMNVFRVADPSGGEKTPDSADVDYPLIEAMVDRLLTHPEIVGSLLQNLNRVKTLLNSGKIDYTALPTALNTILGVPYYPPAVSNDMLATYFFQGMKDNFAQLGYSNIKNDLFFLPPDEINKIRNEFRGKWNLMHPIQTYDNLKSKSNDFSNRLGMWSGKNIATNNMQ